MLPNVFQKSVSDELVARINQLTKTSSPLWGKMNVSQMLAHCCVTYELVYEDIHPKPNVMMRVVLKTFVKKTVVSETPYKHNGATGPQFIITGEKDFDKEKYRLITYINRTQELGEKEFDGKESHSFGKLTVTEWNNMFYKHLDHHFRQFGV